MSYFNLEKEIGLCFTQASHSGRAAAPDKTGADLTPSPTEWEEALEFK